MNTVNDEQSKCEYPTEKDLAIQRRYLVVAGSIVSVLMIGMLGFAIASWDDSSYEILLGRKSSEVLALKK